jgi:hypothetical protein
VILEDIEVLYKNGLRCRADRDGDCACGRRYRAEGIEHCYLDIIDDRENPERHGI